MATITITTSEVKSLLYAESTNVSRTVFRQDGVWDGEKNHIDDQAFDTLYGAWLEATSKLSEKMHEFLNGTTLASASVAYNFEADTQPDGLSDNIKMYIVDYMMQDWLASVRPDYRQRYIDRCTLEMDDLLRKLYKKEPPV